MTGQGPAGLRVPAEVESPGCAADLQESPASWPSRVLSTTCVRSRRSEFGVAPVLTGFVPTGVRLGVLGLFGPGGPGHPKSPPAATRVYPPKVCCNLSGAHTFVILADFGMPGLEGEPLLRLPARKSRGLMLLLCAVHWASALEPRDMSSKSPYWLRAMQPAASMPEGEASKQREQPPHTVGTNCTAVSLTMLTRHGSRSADKQAEFDMPISYLVQAESASALTVEGSLALQKSRALAARLQNITWGDLSPLGHAEVAALGESPRSVTAPAPAIPFPAGPSCNILSALTRSVL